MNQSEGNRPPFRCPFCDGEFDPGVIELKQTLGGFLIAGFSHLVLNFRSSRGKRQILKPSTTKGALSCQSCGTLIVPGNAIRLPRQGS